MGKIFITALLFFALSALHAQKQPDTGPWKFHSINTVGLLVGQIGSAFQVQTVNGLQHKSWFAGVGLGLDFYRFRGIPLFLDLRKEFGSSANKFFLYGDAGAHFNWMTENQKNNNLYTADGNVYNGFYSDAGIGYSIRLDNKTSWLLSAGYSYKTINETHTNFSPVAFDGPPSRTHDRYGLGRLTIKAGWKF